MNLSHFDPRAVAARFGLKRREDDFSVQYMSEFDPRFFFRVIAPVADPVEITDLLPGEMDERSQGECLAFALADLGLRKVRELRFTGIEAGPRGDADDDLGRLNRVIEVYAVCQNRFISAIEPGGTEERRTLMVQFHDLS